MRFGTEEGRRALTSRPRPEPQKQNAALVPSVYITVVLVRLSAPLSSCSPQPNASDSWFQRGFSSSVGFKNHHACVHSRELTLESSLLPFTLLPRTSLPTKSRFPKRTDTPSPGVQNRDSIPKPWSGFCTRAGLYLFIYFHCGSCGS